MSKTLLKPGALIWDLPTRLFHWALSLLVFVSFLSEDNRAVHQRVGIALLTLVVFRLIWGVIGGCYARFSSFVRGPKTVLAHIAAIRQPNPPQPIGHNPAGGWMIVLLLLLILVQAGTGLFSSDIIAYVGPLGHLVSDDLSKKITIFHKIMSKLILATIAIHIVAIVVYYVWKKHNLLTPMLSGYRDDLSDDDLPPLAKRSPPLWRALLVAVFAILLVAAILSLGR